MLARRTPFPVEERVLTNTLKLQNKCHQFYKGKNMLIEQCAVAIMCLITQYTIYIVDYKILTF